MYRCPKDAVDLLNVPYRQVVKIEVHAKSGDFTLTEKDVLQGGLTIDRYSVSGSKIEIGSAVAGELTLKIKNDDGRFNSTRFEGAEMNVWVGVKKWDAKRWENAQVHWIPCGYFTVDTPPRTLSTIQISALDRMVKFSREIDTAKLVFPMEVEALIQRCCTLCGVTCGSDLTKLVNSRYIVKECPQAVSGALTYRQLIAWAAELTGTCAYIDWNGQLQFAWYEDTGEVFDASRRYSSDLYENDITITGVSFTDDDEAKTRYLAGTADYAFDISGNALVQGDFQNVVDTLYLARKGFSYRPYEATVKPVPYLWPLDMIHFMDKDGNDHLSVVTHVTFTLNTATRIAGVGETEQNDGYAVGELTGNQRRILEAMNREQNRELTSREQALVALNEMIGGSLGLYYTEVKTDNETPVRYFHNAVKLEDSNVIYTFGANGFAWTDNWNGGNPVWQYGFTKDGNAVYNALSAYKINADYIEAHSITTELLSSEYISKTEQDLADVFDGANNYTDEKLKGYSTAEEVRTAIKQSADSITLEVSKTYATKNSLGEYTKTNEIRSKFAMDSTSIEIESGVISFKSNTITIESDNFNLTGKGEVSAKGTFISIGQYATSKLYGGNIEFEALKYFTSRISGGVGKDGSTMWPILTLNTDGLYLRGTREIFINTAALKVQDGYDGTAYLGQSVTKSFISSIETTTTSFTCMTDFHAEGNGYAWNNTTYTIPIISRWVTSSVRFVNGIMVTT